MLRRYDLYLPVMFLCLSMSAVGDITMTNGADLDMNGSTGSTVIFPDGTVLRDRKSTRLNSSHT